jgi:hypothetical protein
VKSLAAPDVCPPAPCIWLDGDDQNGAGLIPPPEYVVSNSQRGAHVPLMPLTHLKKREKGAMPATILICGSPADGFQIVGLFADSGDAESYAEDHSLRDWWIAELTSPEVFAERQRRRFRAPRGPML